MKKTLLAAGAAILLSSFAFAEKGTVYISPNNDGVQDILDIPLKIKEKRYVSEWALVIENEKGEVVRTIGNKDKRPTRITFKTFWKSFFTPKSGVTVPSSVAWNGVMDNGEVAPDGNYFYYVTASDDNGNKASTKKLSVVVDNTAPEIEIQQPSSDGKIFGEGAKTLFTVRQNGSSEDLWTGEFLNSEGNVVMTRKWVSSEPLKFDWAGTDDTGAPLPDGIYSYRISAKDRAGNVSAPAGITNIIYSAEKPATNVAVSGSRYFSPNGNGVNDTVTFLVNIPLPDVRSGNRLTNWAVKIADSKGKIVRTYEGTDNPPETVIWDGNDDASKKAAEGEYQAIVTAKYLNGYEPDVVRSPNIVLDTTAPAAKIKASSLTFSPDGDGNLDVLEITQNISENSGSPIENWTGKIVDENGNTVREFDFGANPPSSIEWDGLNASSAIAADGKYNYILSATDMAGNSSEIQLESAVALDTTKTELMLAASPKAFNPASSSSAAFSSVVLTPVVKSGSAISNFSLEVKDSAGTVVWSQSGNSLPSSFKWNGKSSSGDICADGNYFASLSTKSANGAEAAAKSQNFVIDTVAPSVKLSPEYVLFSPDGDGRKDTIPVSVESSSEDKWVATVTNAQNQTVWSKVYSGKIPAKFEWDGTDNSGNKVSDGDYRLAFSATDSAGNFGTAEIANVKVDKRETKAYLTAELDAFSPNGDNYLESQAFALRATLLEGIDSWSFDIVSPEGKSVRQWSSDPKGGEKNGKDAVLPSEITWDGLDSENKVAEGIFTGNLKISYRKGNFVDVKSSAFICSITPPDLAVKTAPQYFSPDNDGENDELYINLKGSDIVPLKNWSFVIKDPENGKPFWKISGKSSITEQVVWDGRGNNGELVQSAMDYPYTFTVTDSLGLTSEVNDKISVDVLVIREGDVLKMAVPAIIFRQDEADFGVQVVDASGKVTKKGITEAQAKNNERVLKRIAQILNKFKNYTVTVEGHANSVTGLEDEETTNKYGKALEPLSKDRAEFVIGKLESYGVAGSRLTGVGRGGRKPVAKLGDKDNAWKNRRVEFILHK